MEGDQPAIERIRFENGFEELDFRGGEPRYKIVIDGVLICHNDDLLVERDDDGRLIAIGTGDIYVVLPDDSPDEHLLIDNFDDEVQVRKFAHTD